MIRLETTRAGYTDIFGRRVIILGTPNLFANSNLKKGETMKSKQILLTAFSIAAFTVGCKPTDQNNPPPGDAAVQLERVKKEAKDTVQASKDYAYAQKTEFAEQMKKDIAALEKEMDQLGAKIESSSAAAKDEAKAKLQTLRDKTAELNKKLDGVKDATESTWDDVKAGVKKGYEETKDAFNQARQWLSDKIAP